MTPPVAPPRVESLITAMDIRYNGRQLHPQPSKTLKENNTTGKKRFGKNGPRKASTM